MAELEFDLGLTLGDLRLEAAARVPLQGITAISGPSGSGKTTLLRALAGLVPEVRGRVRCGDRDWTGLAPERRRIGFVFQEARLFPHLSVGANIAYGARRRGRTDLVPGIVESLGLGALMHRRTGELSGGEARRVALARALASDPEVLFLDEPLAGLDGARRDAVLALLAGTVRAAGLPALYVTHEAAEIAAVADRVLGLSGGRLTGWGPAPQRLRLVQEGEARGGVLVLRLGESLLRLPWSGPSGAPGLGWSLPLEPGRYLLAAGPVGEISSGLALPVRVEGPSAGTLRVSAGTQVLDLPAEAIAPGPATLVVTGPRPLPESAPGAALGSADSRL